MLTPEDNKWFKQIDAYLRGELSDAECKAFEHQLTQDSELKKEVVFRKEVKKTLQEESALSDFRDLQQTIEQEIASPPPSSSSRWLYLIISILLISSAIYFYSSHPSQTKDDLEVSSPRREMPSEDASKESINPPSNTQEETVPSKHDSEALPAETDQPSKSKDPIASANSNANHKALLAIADQYYHAPLIGQLDFGTERGGAKEDSLFTIAAQSFNQQDFKTAFSVIKTLHEKYPQQKELFYPLGVCYLSTDPSKALPLLAEAFNYNPINREQWQLTLAYLKTGATEAAKKNLQDIIAESMNPNDLYKVNAIQLLQKIEAINRR